MKLTLFLILLLVTVGTQAQVISIPDSNFKNQLLNSTLGFARDANGNAIVVDVNNDNEIQVNEAMLVYELHVTDNNITSLEGIQSFLNLTFLDCSNNNLSNISLSSLTELETVVCTGNNLTMLDVEGLENLETLNCSDNQLSAIDFAEIVNLRELKCSNNQLVSLNVSLLEDLRQLECNNNSMLSLSIGGLSHLKTVLCNNNNLTALSLTGLDSLEVLDCSHNDLNVLNLAPAGKLKQLICSNNSFTTLDFTELEYLEKVLCDNNQLTVLDFSLNPQVYSFSCMFNNITFINMKNGMEQIPATGLENVWHNNPLEFVCVDEDEHDIVANSLIANGYNNVNFNTYCSFTPGGAYNTIEGVVKFDEDNDGCNNDAAQSFVKLHINDGAETKSVFTSSTGAYSFHTQAGTFTVEPVFEADYYSVTPSLVTVNFPSVDNSVAAQDICVTADGAANDVEVVMVPVVPARPGEDAVYKIVYKNKGNQVVSGSITCLWNYLKFGNATLVPVPDVQVSGNYTWNYSNLRPFENRGILMTLEVNPTTGANAVAVGEVLPFIATATTTGTDAMPNDNEFVLSQKVVDTFQGNSIICVQGDNLPAEAIDEYLHYVVNFENIGNTTADFVVVAHEINPADFDISTLQVLNSTHQMTARVSQNTVEFIFKNISLAAMDHGNILFKLKPKNGLLSGDTVVNQANIYFNYNAAVATNQAATVFGTLNSHDYRIDESIKIYPNPTAGLVNITAETDLQSVELYDIQGRLLQTSIISGVHCEVDIAQRAAGIYFIKIKTETGSKVEKLIKE